MSNTPNRNSNIALYLRSLILVSVLSLGGIYAGKITAISAFQQHDDPYSALGKLAKNIHRIQNEYLHPVSTEELVSYATQGMVEHLDEHSHFFPPSEYAQLQQRVSNWYVGGGIEINEAKIITQLYSKGPAALVGIMVGDQLSSINNISVADWSVSKVHTALQGSKGSQLHLSVIRNAQEREFTIVLDDVQVVNVECTAITPEYVYIRIERFADGVAQEILERLSIIEQVNGTKNKGIVLDLRDNLGGEVESGIEVADIFLEKGQISQISYRHPENNQLFQATKQHTDTQSRLVVLINSNTASAAELVAGALQSLHRATIVGSNSYGKGTVQKLYKSENDAIKLTVGTFTAGTQEISPAHPITPDIIVDSPMINPKTALDEAIQKSTLSTPEKENLRLLLSKISDTPTLLPIPWNIDFTQRLTLDPQLQMAWKTVQNP